MRTIGIVGDSRGIGAALREQLLAQGHRVIGVSRSGVQRAAGDAENYQSLVFDAVAHPCDLSGFTDQLDGLVQKIFGLSLNAMLDMSRVLNSKCPKQRA